MIAFRSIRAKLLVSYVAVVTVPLLVLGALFVDRLAREVNTRLGEAERAGVRQLATNLNGYLDSILEISQEVYLNEQVTFYLGRRYTNPGASAIGYYQLIQPLFSHYDYGRPGISRMTLAVVNPTILANGAEVTRVAPGDPDWPWYAAAQTSPGTVLWDVLPADPGEARTIRLSRSLGFNTPDLGVFIVDIAESELYRFISQESPDVIVSIAAPDGTIVSSHDRARIGTPIDDVLRRRSHRFEPMLVESFSLARVSPGSWTIVKELPEGAIAREVHAVQISGILACLAIFAMAIGLSIWLSRRLTNPIVRLSDTMRTVQTGDFSVRLNSTRRDEMGRLERSFDTMVHELDTLMKRTVRAEVQKRDLELRRREAELYALESQVDPHFLFNTLEAVAQGIDEGREETGTMIRHLARLIRKRLDRGGDLVALENELATVREYLEVARFRLGDRVRFSIECPHDLLAVQVPRLTVQPLVENAVLHGLSSTKHGGHIIVRAFRSGIDATIEVRDDGAGIAPAEIDAIRASLAAHAADIPSGHIGLVNIHARLTLLFGERHGLTIDAEHGVGTTISFSVPAGGRAC